MTAVSKTECEGNESQEEGSRQKCVLCCGASDGQEGLWLLMGVKEKTQFVGNAWLNRECIDLEECAYMDEPNCYMCIWFKKMLRELF